MADKYLKTGGLNPAWCEEQRIEQETDEIVECIQELLDSGINANIDLELADGVVLHISDVQIEDDEDDYEEEDEDDTVPMCELVKFKDNDYEEKFNFIKRHSDNPEDLKLAREIIGLDP